MKPIFGKDLSSVFNDKWGSYGGFAWPFLQKQVANRNAGAARWLDLCCGTGAFLKIVSQNGFSATGVDLSRHQLAHARRNAPDAELLARDIRALSLNRKFDVITCLGDSLNYLTSDAELAQVFRDVRECLPAKGLFMFDMMTHEGLITHWRGTETIHEPRLTFIMEQSYDQEKALGRYVFTGFVKEGKLFRRFREEHFERGYRGEEIEGLLAKAGLAFRKYDGYTLGRAKTLSERLLYVCGRG